MSFNRTAAAAVLVFTSLVLTACAASEDDAASEDVGASSDAISNSVGQGTALRTTARLNFREGPSSSSRVILVMRLGAIVRTLSASASNGYLNVSYDGLTGWAHSAYLQKVGDDQADDNNATDTSSSSNFNGKVFSDVTMLWEGDYNYLAKCDPPWGAQFSCNGSPTRDYVDNAAWIAVPHVSFSKALCNKSARICKGSQCILAKVMDRGSTSAFEGSTSVLKALGVNPGAKGCDSYGTTTGVTVTLE